MKSLIVVILIFLLTKFSYSKVVESTQFVYASPAPNSKLVKVNSSIILNFSEKQNEDFLNEYLYSLTGNKSGIHSFNLKLSDDEKVIIVSPKTSFAFNEVVTVKLPDGTVYNFQTEKKSLKLLPDEIIKSEINNSDNLYLPRIKSFKSANDYSPLPLDFPQITVTNSQSPSAGFTFMSNFPFSNIEYTPYIMILDNTGYPVYYKKMQGKVSDFKKQPNGNLTYYDWNALKFYEMNNTYNIIDSINCGNGYTADLHELRILKNGHYLLMSYDPQVVNMSDVIAGGDTEAVVTGLVIQELDASKNVIFQWRSWDHFQITDATHEDLAATSIDYVHGNALEMDTDGNILLSCRHMDEITKINRATGDIIWRLGGKNNQFNFLNDTDKFSHQHAIRRIANGNITLLDNGNFHSPNYSRAVEYKLDEVNKTAQLVWQFKNTPVEYGNAMGYVERLTNGNTFISWGTANPSVTEVTPDGTKVFEMTLPQGQFSYRSFHDDWNTSAVRNTPLSYNLYQNYPNPFNPVTKISFDIPKAEDVNIEIYNLLGQKMLEINKPGLSAGTYEYTFDGSGFSSGIYFYQIQTASFNATKRMILVK